MLITATFFFKMSAIGGADRSKSIVSIPTLDRYWHDEIDISVEVSLIYLQQIT